MASIGDTTAAGLLLVRKVKAKGGNKKDGKSGATKLEMLLLQTNKGELTIPKGVVELYDNELESAQRFTAEKIGVSSDQYDVFQEFGFVMEDNSIESDIDTIVYWIAVLKDEDVSLSIAREYKSYTWIDFTVIHNIGLSAVGKLSRDIGSNFHKIIDKSQIDGIAKQIVERDHQL